MKVRSSVLKCLLSGIIVTGMTVASSTPLLADADARLSQPVSIECKDARLHTVLETLSSKTGVTILSGRNTKDWQTRDIPVTVCVKDVPLGKLLRNIADSTHLVFASVARSGDDSDKPLSYRILRDKKGQDDLDADRNAQYEYASWSWDALVAFGDSPDDKTESSAASQQIIKETKVIGRLLALLGPDAKEKVFAGDAIVLSGKSAAYSEIVGDLYGVAQARSRIVGTIYGASQYDISEPPTKEEIDQAKVTIKLNEMGVGAASVTAAINIFPVYQGPNPSVWAEQLFTYGQIVPMIAKGLKLAPPPAGPNGGKARDLEGSKLKFLIAKEDWETPTLQAKVKLDLPQDRKDLTSADVLEKLAKASGFSIVAEDFDSHCDRGIVFGSATSIQSLPSESTVAGALKALAAWHWSIDEQNKLIIGWSRGWRDHHRNLVAESFLSTLCEKLKSGSLDLDDITPIANLTTGQTIEWIYESKDLKALNLRLRGGDKLVWQLYDALDPQDKKLAKSDEGLRLAKIDPEWLADFLRSHRRYAGGGAEMSSGTPEAVRSYVRSTQFKNDLSSDPRLFASLTMRLKPDQSQPKPWLNCSIELTGERDGQPIQALTASIVPPNLPQIKFEPIATGTYSTSGPSGTTVIGEPRR